MKSILKWEITFHRCLWIHFLPNWMDIIICCFKWHQFRTHKRNCWPLELLRFEFIFNHAILCGSCSIHSILYNERSFSLQVKYLYHIYIKLLNFVWVLISSRSRSFYSGVCAALNQLFALIATKTYFDFEQWITLPGAFLFYGFIGVIGLVINIVWIEFGTDSLFFRCL